VRGESAREVVALIVECPPSARARAWRGVAVHAVGETRTVVARQYKIHRSMKSECGDPIPVARKICDLTSIVFRPSCLAPVALPAPCAFGRAFRTPKSRCEGLGRLSSIGDAMYQSVAYTTHLGRNVFDI